MRLLLTRITTPPIGECTPPICTKEPTTISNLAPLLLAVWQLGEVRVRLNQVRVATNTPFLLSLASSLRLHIPQFWMQQRIMLNRKTSCPWTPQLPTTTLPTITPHLTSAVPPTAKETKPHTWQKLIPTMKASLWKRMPMNWNTIPSTHVSLLLPTPPIHLKNPPQEAPERSLKWPRNQCSTCRVSSNSNPNRF